MRSPMLAQNNAIKASADLQQKNAQVKLSKTVNKQRQLDRDANETR